MPSSTWAGARVHRTQTVETIVERVTERREWTVEADGSVEAVRTVRSAAVVDRSTKVVQDVVVPWNERILDHAVDAPVLPASAAAARGPPPRAPSRHVTPSPRKRAASPPPAAGIAPNNAPPGATYLLTRAGGLTATTRSWTVDVTGSDLSGGPVLTYVLTHR